MAETEDLIWRLKAENSDLKNKLAQSKSEVKSFSAVVKKNSEELTKVGQISGLAFAAVAANIGIASKKFIDFDSGMRNFNSIAKLNNKEFDTMSDKVLELSKVYPQTAQTLTEGLYQVVSAGISAGDSIEVLDAAARAATAGMSDTNTSVKAIAGTLNAFGFEANEAGRVSDIMFKTVERGMVTFPELAQSIGQVNAVASVAGVSFEEISAGMATLTKNGINAAESATALRSLMLSLVKPSEELKEVYKQMGVESGEALLKERGLQGALEEITKISGTSATELSKLITEKRGFQGAAILAGKGAKSFAEDLGEMADSAGAAQDAFDEQSRSTKIAVDKMKSSIDALYIGIGKDFGPAITLAANSIGSLANIMSKVNSASGGMLSAMLTTGAALTGLTSAAAFSAVGLIKLKGAIATSTVATKIFGTALKMLPIFAIAAGVAALTGALFALGSHMQDVSNKNKTLEASNKGVIDSHKKSIEKFKELGEEEVEFVGRTMKASEAVKILEGAIQGLEKQELNLKKDKTDVGKQEITDKKNQTKELTQTEIEKSELIAQIREDANLEAIEKRQLINDLEIEDEKKLAEKIMDIKYALIENEKAADKIRAENTRAAIMGVGDIFGSFATIVGEASEQAFNMSKALNYGQAIMSTAAGIAKSLELPPPLNFIEAAAKAAAGAAQVATISQTKYNPAGAEKGVFDFRAPGNNEKLVTTLGRGESIIPETMTEAMKSGKAGLEKSVNITIKVEKFISTDAYLRELSNEVRGAVQRGIIKASAFTGATS